MVLRIFECAFPPLAHCAKNKNICCFSNYISLYIVRQKCNKWYQLKYLNIWSNELIFNFNCNISKYILYYMFMNASSSLNMNGRFYLVKLQISTLLKEIKMKLYFNAESLQWACSSCKIFLGLSHLSEPPSNSLQSQKTWSSGQILPKKKIKKCNKIVFCYLSTFKQ